LNYKRTKNGKGKRITEVIVVLYDLPILVVYDVAATYRLQPVDYEMLEFNAIGKL
jgi:hypothetical protein